MYYVEIINDGDSIMKIKSKDSEFIIDTKGKGITPPDTLLASLGSCIGVYIRKYAEGAKLTLSGFDMRVEAEFSKEKPISFKNINLSINLKGVALEEQRKEAFLKFIRNCPIHNTLKNSPHVEINLS